MAKRLKAVEVMPTSSNQHEFNGVRELRSLFGDGRLADCPAHFIWFGDEGDVFAEHGVMTWYDARERHPTRSEFRLYFRSNEVMDAASTGDLLLLARQRDDSLLAVVAPGESTMEGQLLWLFDVPVSDERDLEYRDLTGDDEALGFAERYILEELGIETEEPESADLDALVEPFGLSFPTTVVFSAFARETLRDVNPLDGPDAALLAWMEREEALFRRLEKRIVASRLEQGFFSDGEADVDGFVSFSLSVQNRRKSRVGHALENHLQEIFDQFGLAYARGACTEGRKKPDFLFPGPEAYADPEFPSSSLRMLGVKSTCKDRWRQVLSEAARIDHKHLLTLEPAISTDQTAEMQAAQLQLVLPESLHSSYKPLQQHWLMSVSQFIAAVQD
ncbi:type II restriction endonuclease [Pseudohaliea rubra]|uniref:type II restriction endonuclease n=1 Tax=Pseudohaliea rubra TaxID=475795 RepID=UPI00191C01D3|nr:type II restriction endonuclease [Pseudohaliea rubra]